tara:strand:+ start:1980 stop:2570 length:591 start_codon:yes stop_codon:yes gene_type:complete
MSQKHQSTNKWGNYERYYHYSPLKNFKKILKDKYIKTTESNVHENKSQSGDDVVWLFRSKIDDSNINNVPEILIIPSVLGKQHDRPKTQVEFALMLPKDNKLQRADIFYQEQKADISWIKTLEDIRGIKNDQQWIYKNIIPFQLFIGFRFLFNFINKEETKWVNAWYKHNNKTIKPYGKEKQVLINKQWHERGIRF